MQLLNVVMMVDPMSRRSGENYVPPRDVAVLFTMNCRAPAFLAVVVPFVASAQSAGLSVTPVRPAPGSIAQIVLRPSGTARDPIVSVQGGLAGEPLHFIAAASGEWHALGGIPADAQGT